MKFDSFFFRDSGQMSKKDGFRSVNREMRLLIFAVPLKQRASHSEKIERSARCVEQRLKQHPSLFQDAAIHPDSLCGDEQQRQEEQRSAIPAPFSPVP